MSLGQDLADFLLARIAEDEAANRRGPEPESWCDRDEGRHLSYERVLTECSAKRKIVEELCLVSAHADTEYDSGRVCAFTASLLLLADVYADHPDYDQTWRP